jgi:hypothetical protein
LLWVGGSAKTGTFGTDLTLFCTDLASSDTFSGAARTLFSAAKSHAWHDLSHFGTVLKKVAAPNRTYLAPRRKAFFARLSNAKKMMAKHLWQEPAIAGVNFRRGCSRHFS